MNIKNDKYYRIFTAVSAELQKFRFPISFKISKVPMGGGEYFDGFLIELNACHVYRGIHIEASDNGEHNGEFIIDLFADQAESDSAFGMKSDLPQKETNEYTIVELDGDNGETLFQLAVNLIVNFIMFGTRPDHKEFWDLQEPLRVIKDHQNIGGINF